MKDVKRFMKFVKPYKWLILLAIVFGVLKFLFPILSPIILKYTIDEILFNTELVDSQKTDKLLQLMAIVLFFYMIIRPFVEYFRQYFGNHVSNMILRDFREEIYRHTQRLSLKFFNNSKTGEIISKMIVDAEQVKNLVATGLINIWLDVITAIIIIAIMLKLNVTLTIVSLVIFPMYMLVVKLTYKRFKAATKARSKSLGLLQSHLHERIQGIGVIKSFAREKEEFVKFTDKNNDLFDKSTEHTKRNAETFAATNTIAEIAPMIVITLAGIYVINYDLSIGTLVAFVGLLGNLYTPLKRLADSSNVLTQSIASLERVYELIDEKYDIQNSPNASDVVIKRGNIIFENVDFGYDSSKNILSNINLEIPSGKTIAFVGESGGGKSSLINLLPRYYDVTKGVIKIDDSNIKDCTIHSLRKQIGVVSQDSILFNESIYENIRIGKPEATREEVIEASVKAKAHEFISEYPDGYNTEIGERGVKLSGGQKQRIALARAFLKNPPILILDEATSALDLESEAYIQESLKTLTEGRTTLIVAHRLSTIVDSDLIVYMENGEIQETGTHEELMNRQGKYYNLFIMQKL